MRVSYVWGHLRGGTHDAEGVEQKLLGRVQRRSGVDDCQDGSQGREARIYTGRSHLTLIIYTAETPTSWYVMGVAFHSEAIMHVRPQHLAGSIVKSYKIHDREKKGAKQPKGSFHEQQLRFCKSLSLAPNISERVPSTQRRVDISRKRCNPVRSLNSADVQTNNLAKVNLSSNWPQNA